MVDQASVNGRDATRVPPPSSEEIGGIAEFVDALTSLAELQAKLAAIDFKDAARKSALPFAITLAALALMLSGILVALLGAGWLIATAMRIHQGWAMLLTAGVAMVAGGGLAWLGVIRLSQSFDSFHRSRKQLSVNLGWVRAVLVSNDGTRPRPRHRM